MQESIGIPPGGASPADNQQQFATGRLASIRGSCSNQGFSERVTSLLLSSWSAGTNTSYNSAWGKWDRWCCEREADPVQAPLVLVLDFLAELHANGLRYQTINTYRSAISSCHCRVDGFPLGEHPMVKRLMRGLFRVSPPQPRYTHTWSVDTVLTYLKTLGQNRYLSLKVLTLKLTMLLALTAAKRCSELARLDSKFMHFSRNESVTFTLPGLSKTNKSNVTVTFHSYTEDRLLCVIECLNEYLVRTERFRVATEKDPLLRSYIKPHGEIKPCTVARWLKSIMKDAGIDVSIFKAHSTRSASSSKVFNKGISTKEIMKVANWSSRNTFTKFYRREFVSDTCTDTDSYSRAVLML